MTVISITFLLAIHACILLVCIKLITPEFLTVLLYSSNIVLILNAFGRRWFPSGQRSLKKEVMREIAHNAIAQTAYALSPRDSVHKWPSLYIKRWKAKYLDRPVEYPLDRIAYLKAKYAGCAMDCCLRLKNSQLKQLVKKPDLPGHEQVLDDLHPSKMVNECFHTYLHRRSAFYTRRNVIGGGRKQLTRPGKKIQFREIDGQELMVYEYSSPYSCVVDSQTRGHPCFDRRATGEEDGDDRARRTWSRIRRAFSR